VPWSVWPLAGTTVGLMAVSLTHLSDGVTQLTAIPSWQAWAMAVGIDCMLISVAMAQLTAPAHVKRDIAIVARCMEAGTLVMSAGLNALAFTGGAFDAAHWAQVAFGCFVPAAISGPRISWLGLHGADAGLSPWGEILCDLVTRAVWPVVGPPRFFTRRRLGLDDCFQQCWQPAPPLGLKCMGDLRCMPSILKFGCDPDHYPRIAINLVDGILNSAEPSPSWWPRLAPRRCQAGRLWRRACRLSR
jgi:hypothetical protein